MIQQWTPCEQCARYFAAPVTEILRGRYRFCSWDCTTQWTVATGAQQGENNGNWKGGVSNDNMRYRNRQKERHPIEEAARKAVASAVRAGRIARQPCEVCGATPAQGHHDDYAKPLDVRWLCRRHHDEHHAAERG